MDVLMIDEANLNPGYIRLDLAVPVHGLDLA